MYIKGKLGTRAIQCFTSFLFSLEGERGNKPHIYTREELLDKVVIEVKPGDVLYIQPGTRVCTYWSSQLQYLYPGTVISLQVSTVQWYI